MSDGVYKTKSGLSHLNEVPTKQLDKINFQGVIRRGRNNFFGDVLEVEDVQQPTICLKENLGGGKAGALVTLFEGMRRHDGHHQTHRQHCNILDPVIVEELARP